LNGWRNRSATAITPHICGGFSSNAVSSLFFKATEHSSEALLLHCYRGLD
jgi:hypothetical protein